MQDVFLWGSPLISKYMRLCSFLSRSGIVESQLMQAKLTNAEKKLTNIKRKFINAESNCLIQLSGLVAMGFGL